MPKNQRWVYKPTPPKFGAAEKARTLTKVNEIISTHPKMSDKVSRVDMRANRVYLYELVEQIISDSALHIEPLIDDKFLEFPYARLTLLDTQGARCTADFQRHNNQWVTLYDGTLEECLSLIENDNAWF